MDTLELTAGIVIAYLKNNPVDEWQLPEILRSVHQSLENSLRALTETNAPQPAVPVKRSIFDDHLVCLECGGKFTMLKRHLKAEHHLTPGDYRRKFDLPYDYPVIAATYTAKHSKLPRQHGLCLQTGRTHATRQA